VNRRPLIVFFTVTAALALAACAALQVKEARLASMLRFSHEKHAAEGIECGDCHDGIEESKGLAKGRHIPTKETCQGCHEDEVEKKCDLCHIGADQQVKLSRPQRKLHFSHAAHQERDKEGCKGCHPAALTSRTPGQKLITDMAGCANRCHKADLEQLRCSKCHLDLERYPIKPVAALGHGGGFIKRHGPLAKDPARCATCHDQTQCADCHARTAAVPLSLRFPEKVDARFIHRGDYVGRHARDAKADATTCRKCHGSRHCSSCHASQGLSRATTSSGAGQRKKHGAQWMMPGTPGFHGRKARREINACASCHDRGAASNCVTCHTVGAMGGNPHPRRFNWAGKADACRSDGMCAVCHTSGSGCP